jgi:hypothetical protein
MEHMPRPPFTWKSCEACGRDFCGREKQMFCKDCRRPEADVLDDIRQLEGMEYCDELLQKRLDEYEPTLEDWL